MAAACINCLMYVMRQTQIKGAKRSGKETDKEIGQQNILGKKENARVRKYCFREDSNRGIFEYEKFSNFFLDTLHY